MTGPYDRSGTEGAWPPRDRSSPSAEPTPDDRRGGSADRGPAGTAGPADAGLDAGPDDLIDVDGWDEVVEPDRADPSDLGDPIADIVVTLTRERDDFREALIRLQADFENYKKRMVKQQTDHLERAAATLVEKLLPVLDTADLAVAHGSGEDVKQISAALFGSLEREGLERIDPLGAPFDPTVHDAVAHEPGEGGQEVAEVLRAGYRWKGMVLRPAMVKVRG
jgi:molecular chaperone GrpE